MAQKDEKTVLPAKLGGGPHGVGDPEDKTLRPTEMNVLIPQLVRDRARTTKCTDEVKTFGECCKSKGILMTFKCKEETAQLKECLGKWFHDDDFREECTQVYLDQRSEFRRTGISKKQREKMEREKREYKLLNK